MTPLSILRAHRACILSARALLVQQLKAFDAALETADRLIGEAEAEQASEHVEPLAYVPPGPWTMTADDVEAMERRVIAATGILDFRGRLMKIDRDQPVPTPDPDTPIPSDRQVFR